jgi:hypothetical protein
MDGFLKPSQFDPSLAAIKPLKGASPESTVLTRYLQKTSAGFTFFFHFFKKILIIFE